MIMHDWMLRLDAALLQSPERPDRRLVAPRMPDQNAYTLFLRLRRLETEDLGVAGFQGTGAKSSAEFPKAGSKHQGSAPYCNGSQNKVRLQSERLDTGSSGRERTGSLVSFGAFLAHLRVLGELARGRTHVARGGSCELWDDPLDRSFVY